MTPPSFIRYDELLCTLGNGEYSMCVARIRNGGRCMNSSTTIGSLCNMHTRALQKYKRITTHYYINVCKGCRTTPTSTNLCNNCSDKYCIIGSCRNSPTQDALKCIHHQPRCTTCKKASYKKIGNKYLCQEHCKKCLHCDELIEIESYRTKTNMCKSCFSMKCLHRECNTLVTTEIRYCNRHMPSCRVSGCTEQIVFCYRGISRCHTHEPKCHNCTKCVSSKNIKHITMYDGFENYRFYCCSPLPMCKQCNSCAHFESSEKMFESLCVIHNHMCGFPNCTNSIMPLGHYCNDHWSDIEIFHIIAIEALNKKQNTSDFMSFVRCLGRSKIIKKELCSVVSLRTIGRLNI